MVEKIQLVFVEAPDVGLDYFPRSATIDFTFFVGASEVVFAAWLRDTAILDHRDVRAVFNLTIELGGALVKGRGECLFFIAANTEQFVGLGAAEPEN